MGRRAGKQGSAGQGPSRECALRMAAGGALLSYARVHDQMPATSRILP